MESETVLHGLILFIFPVKTSAIPAPINIPYKKPKVLSKANFAVIPIIKRIIPVILTLFIFIGAI